jgi:DNA replication and repair protein RecF
MIVKRFKAENFRNIEKCDISFSSGINLLHGKNAQGKTNALEGIYIFSRGKSFRAADEKDLIKSGEKGFNLFLEYESEIGKETLEYSVFERERTEYPLDYAVRRCQAYF